MEEMNAAEQSAMDAMRKGEAMDLPDEPESQDTITAPRATETREPEAAVEPKADKPPEGHVPHGALHEERERRKAAETQLAEFKAELAAIKARLPAAEPPPEPEDDMPDPILQPAEYKAWVKAQFAEARKPAIEIAEQQQRSAAERQRLVTAERLEQEFVARTPDFPEAAKQLHGQRVAELKALGWSDQRTLDQAGNAVLSEVEQIISSEVNAIFDNAQRLGKNPAELLYEQAKLRGWKAPKPAPVVDDGARIAAQAAAQENVATLSMASGEAQEGGLTMKQLAEMDEFELAELKKKDPKKFAKAMGA